MRTLNAYTMADQLIYYIPGAAAMVLAVLVLFSECSRISRRVYFKARISSLEEHIAEREARMQNWRKSPLGTTLKGESGTRMANSLMMIM